MNENKLTEDVANLSRQVNEMHTALIGSAISKDGGIVQRMTDIESKLESMEKKQTVLGVQFKILWAGAGAVVMGLYSVIFKK